MNMVRISILNRIKKLTGVLKDYAGGLPFGGTNKPAARGKSAVNNKPSTGKWPGVMRGYGPITRLYDWENRTDF
jgi:hypothetical protein